MKGKSTMNMFKKKMHLKIFEKKIELFEKQGYALSNRFMAALYLLSSHSQLWKECKYRVTPNKIDFKAFNLKGIDVDGYILCKTAFDIFTKTSNVSVADLSEKHITSEEILENIINSILIARHGKYAVSITLLQKRKE